MAQAQAPLTGRVLVDLSTLLPGPYASLLLAQLGCRVIKVEPPAGDPLRRMQPGLFALVNAGKESVVADLKDPSGRRELAALVRSADAVLTSFLPDTAQRLGVSPAALHADNPTAIVCRVLGRQPDSADLPSHDLDILALAGAFAFGPVAGSYPLGLPIADLAAGAMAAFALSAALGAPVGPGRVLDVSMEDVLRTWVAMAGSMATVAAWREPRDGLPRMAGYGVYTAGDGRELVIAAVEDRFWAGVVTVLDLEPAWSSLSLDERKHRSGELNDAVRARLRTASAADWVDRLQAAGVAASPVRTPAETLAASDPDGPLRIEPAGRVALRFPARGIGVDLPAAPELPHRLAHR
jgi:crotonobetainyl-CoA:carnitine CoA-transferase CaiB-like acyl-CoA transferase